MYDAFLGSKENAFYYGHSYTANPIGCAAALASLDLFHSEKTFEKLPAKISLLKQSLSKLKADLPSVLEIRQCGLVAGIEFQEGLGKRITVAARAHGLITRNILDTVVFMPPLSITPEKST